MAAQVIIFSCLILVASALPQNYRAKPPGHSAGAGHPGSGAYNPQAHIEGKTDSKSANQYHSAVEYQNPGAAGGYHNTQSAGYQNGAGGGGGGYQSPAAGHQSPAPVAYQGPAYQGYDQGSGAGGYQSLESPGYRVGGGILFGGLSADDQKKIAAHEHDGTTFHGPSQPHTFGYTVEDSYYGNQHAHNEYSDGKTTKGSYRVLLPDGRTQVVTYSADAKSGFMAQVSYEGKAKPYQHQPEKAAPGHQQPHASSHAPSYNPQQQAPAYQQAQYRPAA
ncbi:cuticle protein 21 [Procambarus clarkii]|uniref:cuticle protein 21 n=1 Tax=Procambarus clarkii TaxID=6728 RepID=UPI0037422B82